MPLENVVCIDPKNTNLQKNRGGWNPPPPRPLTSEKYLGPERVKVIKEIYLLTIASSLSFCRLTDGNTPDASSLNVHCTLFVLSLSIKFVC